MKTKLSVWEWVTVNWRTIYALLVMAVNVATIWGLDPSMQDRLNNTLAAMNGVLGLIIGKSAVDNVVGANKTIAASNALTTTMNAAADQSRAVIVAAAASPSPELILAAATNSVPGAKALQAAADRIADHHPRVER